MKVKVWAELEIEYSPDEDPVPLDLPEPIGEFATFDEAVDFVLGLSLSPETSDLSSERVRTTIREEIAAKLAAHAASATPPIVSASIKWSNTSDHQNCPVCGLNLKTRVGWSIVADGGWAELCGKCADRHFPHYVQALRLLGKRDLTGWPEGIQSVTLGEPATESAPESERWEF